MPIVNGYALLVVIKSLFHGTGYMDVGHLPLLARLSGFWNSLPEDMRDPDVSEDSYRQSLKTFLADRTNGRAIATTLLRLSSVCVSVTLCIVAKRCVVEQKLLLGAYRKSYMRNRLVPK